jgi:hypothetical protein
MKNIVRVPDQGFLLLVPVPTKILLLWSPENYSPSSAVLAKICYI